jgi:hypothetical protein
MRMILTHTLMVVCLLLVSRSATLAQYSVPPDPDTRRPKEWAIPRTLSKVEFITSTPDHRFIRTAQIDTELSYLDAVQVCAMHLLFKPSAASLVGIEDFESRHSHVVIDHDLMFAPTSDRWRGLSTLFLLNTRHYRVIVHVARSRNDSRTHVTITDEDAPVQAPGKSPGDIWTIPARDLIAQQFGHR